MQIETFVFFDLETTGLPHLERNRTKITELCFIAVSRHDLTTCKSGKPITNKLSCVFNPERKIQIAASQKTGLTNMSLKHQQVFKDKIPILNLFLEGLRKPVCLVAHNGNTFDYKVLKAEYNDAQIDLPRDIFCVDSLIGFRKILKDNDLRFDSISIDSHNVTSSTVEEDIVTDDEDEWPELNVSLEDWQNIDKLVITNVTPSDSDSKKSLQLSSLYKRLLNKHPVNAHRAEADCSMLLQCVISTKDLFLPWADKFYILLSSIKPLQRH
ncbi:unnamed protein product [Leptidea sinapis]|uniref:Exonuclease domain-containing protein n=1 Tax=Leptidea sinapis TaxID=189913 RepID=A0A5E4PU73_9NEOP|nr:unnamed protein product [Leptidea sinapis]